MIRLFFATDLHGSKVCFRKFVRAAEFYDVNDLILGGDLTGKGLVPILPHGTSDGYEATHQGRTYHLETERELEDFTEKVKNTGLYPTRVCREEYRRLLEDEEYWCKVYTQAASDRLTAWLEYAESELPEDVTCYFILGNDDSEALVSDLSDFDSVINVEEKVHPLSQHLSIIGFGYSNPTPFDSPRELPEDEIAHRLRKLFDRTDSGTSIILNAHCPPYDTPLDTAPVLEDKRTARTTLGRPQMEHVGSTAVREVLESQQPLLGLHGHCHESRNVHRIGSTLAVNPGSEYSVGVLRGVVLTLSQQASHADYQFVAA